MISRLGVPGLFGMTLGLGLAVLSRSDTAVGAFDPASVRCYAEPAVTATVSERSEQPAAPTPDVSVIRAAVEPLAQNALSRASACAAAQQQCSTVTHAVSAYLDVRRRVTAELYQQHRGHGLAIADHVFANERTQALSSALAALHARQHIDPAQFGANRDALALVLTKPAEAFRPCVRRQVHGYVY